MSLDIRVVRFLNALGLQHRSFTRVASLTACRSLFQDLRLAKSLLSVATHFNGLAKREYCHLNMAPSAISPVATLEKEDHARDAAFQKALHGKSSEAAGGFAAMRTKDKAAQKAAVDEYFKHWDNKEAAVETEETRKARRDEYATLTRQFVLLLAIPQALY